jgi:hypothetical protein
MGEELRKDSGDGRKVLSGSSCKERQALPLNDSCTLIGRCNSDGGRGAGTENAITPPDGEDDADEDPEDPAADL